MIIVIINGSITCSLFLKKMKSNNILVSTTLYNIYCYLPLKDLCNCGMVNKLFNKVFKNEKLWEMLFNKHYGKDIYDLVKTEYNTNSYFVLFKKCHNLEECAVHGDYKPFNKQTVEILLGVTNYSFFKKFTPGFDSLKNLRFINLYNQTISKKAMEKITRFTGLTGFGLCKSNTNYINEISNIKNLTTLMIMHSDIGKNFEIKNFPCLETVILCNNSSSDFPITSNLPSLIKLNINNGIIDISPSMFTLHNLRNLSLANNKIRYISQDIKHLTNLSILDLSSNDFEEFPLAICSLTSLCMLSLQNNKIKIIPEEISALHKLSHLNLSNNELFNLAPLNNLIKINSINVSGNKSLQFPQNIILPSSVNIIW